MFLDEKAFGEPSRNDEPEMSLRLRLSIDICLFGSLFSSWAAYDMMFVDLSVASTCGKVSVMFAASAAALRLLAMLRMYY